MRKIKVAVGLSGGVDSAVAAYLLKKQGFDVSGVYLHCFDDDAPGCRGKQDRQDAVKVALHLKIPFQIMDFSKQYKSAVIGYFKKEYLAGRTPNPDVICNRDIKFGLFLDWAIKAGFDYLATGHYARLVPLADSRNSRTTAKYANPLAFAIFAKFRDFREMRLDTSSKLKRTPDDVILTQPRDLHKDQTYFLWAVPREKFSRVLFPLADFRKQDVRSAAKFAKIPVADKPDSTGICFIGEVRVGDFLKRLGVKEKVGEVVIRRSVIGSPFSVFGSKSISYQSASSEPVNRKLTNQNLKTDNRKLITEDIVVGTHRGVWFYTIGQRHGFEITHWPVIGSPFSVVGFKSVGYQSAGSKPINRKPVNRKPKTDNRKLITDRPPLYVIGKDIKTNRLIVGFGPECYRDQFEVGDCNWLAPELMHQRINASTHCLVRIRHGGDLIPCSVIGSPLSVFSSESAGFQSSGQKPINRKLTNNKPKTENRELITVFLATPQRGVAPGQSAVFYSKDSLVLGGGVIQ